MIETCLWPVKSFLSDLVGALRAAFAEIDQELSLQATKNEGKDQDLDLVRLLQASQASKAEGVLLADRQSLVLGCAVSHFLGHDRLHGAFEEFNFVHREYRRQVKRAAVAAFSSLGVSLHSFTACLSCVDDARGLAVAASYRGRVVRFR